jgi:hypothetical protein
MLAPSLVNEGIALRTHPVREQTESQNNGRQKGEDKHVAENFEDIGSEPPEKPEQRQLQFVNYICNTKGETNPPILRQQASDSYHRR